MQKSVWLTRVIVVLTLAVLVMVVVTSLAGGTASTANLAPFPGTSVGGVLQAAGLLFFAFAGYARIAALGEEVHDPARTIPRAISTVLGIVLIVYVLVAVSALLATGPTGLAALPGVGNDYVDPLLARIDLTAPRRLESLHALQ